MGSYNHRIHRRHADDYIISWTVDYKYASSRLRYPRTDWRNTDYKGALRFAKKHGLDMPVDSSPDEVVK